MEKVIYKPIGVIRSPYKEVCNMPIQPAGAVGVAGTIVVGEDYREGLKDLEGFSHLILIYHFHLSEGCALQVKPFLDEVEHGVFATRAPKRPNPVGLSVVRLVRIEGLTLHIEDVDVIDGTPLLDIKPYVPLFDIRPDAKSGWLADRGKRVLITRADDRFKT